MAGKAGPGADLRLSALALALLSAHTNTRMHISGCSTHAPQNETEKNIHQSNHYVIRLLNRCERTTCRGFVPGRFFLLRGGLKHGHGQQLSVTEMRSEGEKIQIVIAVIAIC